jgi:large subunit ribosomal protein L33
MASKGTDIRPTVKLRSTAGTGYTHVTRKNRRNDPDRVVLRKYDPVVGRHVDFRGSDGGRFGCRAAR